MFTRPLGLRHPRGVLRLYEQQGGAAQGGLPVRSQDARRPQDAQDQGQEREGRTGPRVATGKRERERLIYFMSFSVQV